MAGMTAKDAWLYAASWGSFMTSGDPGACMYGFDENFRVQSEQHRADCLEQMEANRADVEASPADYDDDELDQIDAFVSRLKEARLESDPDPLDGLDDFARGYVSAILWIDNAPNAESGREFEAQAESEEDENEGSFPASASAEDIAADTLARIKADCDAFQADNADALAEAATRPGYSLARAGNDFWLTRNGHGVGFWDRSELETESPEYERLTAIMTADGTTPAQWSAALAEREAINANSLGRRLTKASKAFREVDSYFGDDGRIHL